MGSISSTTTSSSGRRRRASRATLDLAHLATLADVGVRHDPGFAGGITVNATFDTVMEEGVEVICEPWTEQRLTLDVENLVAYAVEHGAIVLPAGVTLRIEVDVDGQVGVSGVGILVNTPAGGAWCSIDRVKYTPGNATVEAVESANPEHPETFTAKINEIAYRQVGESVVAAVSDTLADLERAAARRDRSAQRPRRRLRRRRERAAPDTDGDSVTQEWDGVTVTLTQSAGIDGAVVIFIDGPGHEHEQHLNRDGSPAMRIWLNEDQIYEGRPYEPRDDDEPPAQ